MRMTVSFGAEKLLPFTKRLSSGSEEDGNSGCERHCRDQSQRANQRPHDFFGDKRKGLFGISRGTPQIWGIQLVKRMRRK